MTRSRRTLFAGSLALLLLPAAGLASATAPPPYSIPWQLRPAQPVRVLRLDSVVADYENAAGFDGTTVASLLLGSVKIGPSTSLLGRIGLVSNDAPVLGSATVLTNLAIGGCQGWKLGSDWRLGAYLMAALPTAGGGGNDPEPRDQAAIRSGVPARSAMDNAMFATNDFVLFPGVDLAFVRGGWTVQAEATLLQLWRVRGEAAQADESKTNLTTGLHVGWFPARVVSLGGEVRYQRWLSTPAAVESAPETRDTATLALGPRFHLRAGETSWFRPGVSVVLPLDAPMTDLDYMVVQLDLPFLF